MNPSHPTIFIQIAAYRDPDLPATLHNLLSRAAEPQRIHLGICLQLASADPEDWGNNHMLEHRSNIVTNMYHRLAFLT